MNATIVAAGTELVRLGRPDRNGDWLAARLQEIGIRTAERAIVGDDPRRIAAVTRAAIARGDIVILTGGLGPTADDRTRAGLALALGGALAPSSALPNPVGSAAGVAVAARGTLVFALPGVPGEMRAMFVESVLPRLLELPRPAHNLRSLLVAGMREAAVDARIADLYDTPGVEITILVVADGVELHLVGADDTALEALEHEIRERIGPAVVGRAGERLAVSVGRLLAAARLTVATAESCTAGLLAATLTSVAGSSAWFRGGLVAYADDLKTTLAAVPAEMLAEHGAVSEAVARALARGAQQRCRADVGIGITGIAGPGGGSPDKPIGRVHIALQFGGESHHDRHDLGGDREAVRRRAVALALDRLRLRLEQGQ